MPEARSLAKLLPAIWDAHVPFHIAWVSVLFPLLTLVFCWNVLREEPGDGSGDAFLFVGD